MTTILIALKESNVPADARQKIQALLPDARIIVTNNKEQIGSLIEDVEIAAGHVPVQFLSKARKLRWYQQWGAGTDWLMRNPELARMDFILTNASGVHAIPISEHILAFLLAFARRLPEAARSQAKHQWNRQEDRPAFELAGSTMLLVGVGAIGRRTAQIAAALGMRVIGVRSDPSKPAAGVDHMVGPQQILGVLPEADFVVLTMPLTDQSRGMINREFFEIMKPSAYLVNIGRGGTVDEEALIDALREGKIAGAGLDVFAVEPLPTDSPLWDMPNVLITGHYSGETPHYHERAIEIFLDNLERYTHGQPMRNLVDKKRGY